MGGHRDAIAGGGGGAPSPEETSTLSEYAYGRISHALRSGQFRPGQKLTLRGLSTILGISSTPIRDAIRRLSAENAIDFAPNRYIRVPVLSPTQLRELREIRLALEGLAVEGAAQRAGAEEVEALRRIDAEIRRLRADERIPETVEHIQLFHFTLYGMAGMSHLVHLIEGLWLRTAPYVSLLFPDYSSRERGSLRTMIIEAVARQDPKSARRFLEADVCGAMNFIIGEMERKTRQKARP